MQVQARVVCPCTGTEMGTSDVSAPGPSSSSMSTGTEMGSSDVSDAGPSSSSMFIGHS